MLSDRLPDASITVIADSPGWHRALALAGVSVDDRLALSLDPPKG